VRGTSKPETPATGPDADDGPDFLDLGETAIRRSVTVDPTSVSTRGRRFGRIGPPAVIGLAVLVVIAAVVGGGSLITRPGPSSSPHPTATGGATSPVAVSSPSPSAATCTAQAALAGPPTLGLAARNQYPHRQLSVATVDEVKNAPFDPPVENPVDVGAGYRLVAALSDVRCVEAIRIDVRGTRSPDSSVLTVSSITPLFGGTSYGFDAPPAGDWVVRVAVKLGLPALAATPWAIYLVRLNVGYVAYESPQPEPPTGPIETEGPPEPLVTPASECLPAPFPGPASLPPGVDLVLGDGTRVPGVLGSYQWSQKVAQAVDPSTIPPVDVPFGSQLEAAIDGHVCALQWTVEAGPTPTSGRPLIAAWVWAQFTDNPDRDPAIGSQNVVALSAVAFGDTLVRATFEFGQDGAQEVLYWRLRLGPSDVPTATIRVDSAGASVPMTTGCGLVVSLEDGTAINELCDGGWPDLAPTPALPVHAGSRLTIVVPDWTIQWWYATDIPSGAGADVGGTELGYGNSSLGFATIQLPAPPPGTWDVQVSLAIAMPGHDVYSIPYYVRVVVTP
jgi:hypothetical protein